MRHIKVEPLAAESLGVRSMCTYVETPDVRVLLDGGASLCPSRFGLPPHPREFKTIVDSRKRIAEAAGKAEVVTISHYHFDHHTPSFRDWLCNWTEEEETARQIYGNKTVLLKNPRENINYSQRRRGWLFKKTSGSHARTLEVADGKSFSFGDTKISFSQPVFHGAEGSLLGWVLMTTVERLGEKFMFAPDVQGPISYHTSRLIIDEDPHLLMVGGPPLYLAGFKVSERQMQLGLQNLQKIVEHVPTTILEHHILRTDDWKECLTDTFYAAYKSNSAIVTAAEFVQKPNNLLEANRKGLYESEPPEKDFAKWMRLNEETKKQTPPPI